MASSVNYLEIPGGPEISLRMVVSVSSVFNDQYTVNFSGHHETIQVSDMTRDDFISAWKASE